MLKNLKSYAEHLRAIRDDRLWRVTGEPYQSFDDYCRKKLGFSEQRACQIITATDVMKLMIEKAGDDQELVKRIETLPESVLREMKYVEPEKACDAVRVISVQGKVTAAAVREVVKPKSSKAIEGDFKLVPKISTDQWLDLGRKVPAFQEWWQTQTNQEQETFIQYLARALKP